jgi:hypothetical protein
MEVAMSLVAIVHLAERMLKQGQEEKPAAAPVPLKAGKVRADATWKGEDQFVPSGQSGAAENTAQAAGIFTAARTALFSAAAEFLLGPPESKEEKPRAFAAVAGAGENSKPAPVAGSGEKSSRPGG